MMKKIVFLCFLVGKMLTYAVPLDSTQLTEVRLNGHDKLECLTNADVSENVQIKWFRNDVEVTGNHGNDAFFKSNSTNHLLIVDAEKASGKYKCQVIDNGVSSSSSSFELKPEMLRHLRLTLPHNQTMSQLQVADARNFHAKCHLACHPPGNLTFLHNGNIVKSSSRIAIVTTEQTDGILYELFINQVDKSDVGAYHCRASNGFLFERILSGNIYLKGDCDASTHWMCPNDGVCVPKTECEKYEDCLNFNCEAPMKPDVQIKTITHNMVSLTWQTNEKSKEYTCIVDTPKMKTLSQIYQTKENFLVIDNLKNNTQYAVNIYAANKVGTSEDAYLYFKTRRMVPPQIVESAKVVEKTVRNDKATVTFLWFPPVDDGMENISGELQYTITSCRHGNFSDCERTTTNMTSLDFEINNNVLYTFGIIPYNTAGQAGPIKYVFYRTGVRQSSSGAWWTSSFGFLLLCIQLAFYVAG